MPDCLGIDIGSEALKFAVVERGKKGCVIKAFARYAYPEGALGASARAEFAARTAAEGPYARLPVALSLSGADVFLCPLTVPFTKRSHIAKTLKFEMEGQLPFDVDSAVVDFSIALAAAKSSRLIVAAMPRETLESLTLPFERSGLNVALVTADVLAAASLGAFLGDGKYAVLDVGLSGWKLSVCDAGRLVFARATPAAPASDKVETALGGWFKQGLMAAPADALAEKMYLVGDMSGSVDCQALAEAAGCAVARPEFPGETIDAALAGEKGEIERSCAGSVAAAMALCSGKPAFDFYAAARGRQSPLERVFGPAVAGLVLVTLLFGVLGLGYARSLFTQRAGLAQVRAAEMGLWKQVFPDEDPPGGDVHAALAARIRQLQDAAPERLLGGKAGPILKALYVLSKTRAESAGIQFERFEAAKGAVIVQASAPNDPAAANLAGEINAEGSFDAKTQNFQPEEKRIVFQIVMTPKE